MLNRIFDSFCMKDFNFEGGGGAGTFNWLGKGMGD